MISWRWPTWSASGGRRVNKPQEDGIAKRGRAAGGVPKCRNSPQIPRCGGLPEQSRTVNVSSFLRRMCRCLGPLFP
jgi:hypothetical protein